MTTPDPEPPASVSGALADANAHHGILAVALQWAVCLLGGGWAGHVADPDSTATQLVGAIGMLVGWFAGYAVAQWLAGLLLPLVLLREGVRWLRRPATADPALERARGVREQRLFEVARCATTVAVMLVVAIAVALMVWSLATRAELPGTLAHFLGVAALSALLTWRAQRVVDEISYGNPPP